MGLQWTAIGGFLYFELAITLLLMLPFIPSTAWHRFFHSGFMKVLTGFAHHLFSIFLLLLILGFADACREMYKYEHDDSIEASMKNHPQAVDQIHMKLFRAQRNFYIGGFALFLWFNIRRLVMLISAEAILTANKEAALKQAKGATEAAQRLMNEAENKQSRSDDEGNSMANSKNEAEELRTQLAEARKDLKKKEADLEAMKAQATSTNREFDKLSAEYQSLQKKMEATGDGKKSH